MWLFKSKRQLRIDAVEARLQLRASSAEIVRLRHIISMMKDDRRIGKHTTNCNSNVQAINHGDKKTLQVCDCNSLVHEIVVSNTEKLYETDGNLLIKTELGITRAKFLEPKWFKLI